MKIGTILINPYTTESNPKYKSVYLGIEGNYFKTITLDFKCTAKYYKQDLHKFIIDGFATIKEG